MHLCTVALYEFVYKFPCSLSASPIPGGRGCRGSRNSGGPKELSIFCADFSILNHDIFPCLVQVREPKIAAPPAKQNNPNWIQFWREEKNRTRKPPKNIETHTHTSSTHTRKNNNFGRRRSYFFAHPHRSAEERKKYRSRDPPAAALFVERIL